jgi:hypothetical protein
MMLKSVLARTICTLYYVNVNEKLPSGAGTAYNSMRHHQFLVGFVVLEGVQVVGSNNSYKPITNITWVCAQLCKLQKRVHSTCSHK